MVCSRWFTAVPPHPLIYYLSIYSSHARQDNRQVFIFKKKKLMRILILSFLMKVPICVFCMVSMQGRPGELALLSQKNWLSPVIQATWEARTVGWLVVEWLLPPDRSDAVAALRPPCSGRCNRGGVQLLWREEARLHHASTEATRVRVPARPSSQYCNCNVQYVMYKKCT